MAGAMWVWLGATGLLDQETRGEEAITYVDDDLGGNTGTFDVVCKPISVFDRRNDGATTGDIPSDGYIDPEDAGSISVPNGDLGTEINRLCEGRRVQIAAEVSSRRSIAVLLGASGLMLLLVAYAEWRFRNSIRAEADRIAASSARN